MALVMPQGPPFGSGAPWSQPSTQLFGSGMRPPVSGSFMGSSTPPMPPPSSSYAQPFPPAGFGIGSAPGSYRGPPPTNPFDSIRGLPPDMGSAPFGSMGSLPPPPDSMGPSFRPPTSSFSAMPPFGPSAVNPGMRPMTSFGTGSLDGPQDPMTRGFYADDIESVDRNTLPGTWADTANLEIRAHGDNLGHFHTAFGHHDPSLKDLISQPLFVDEAPPPSDRPLHVGPYYSLHGAPLTLQYGVNESNADSVVVERQKEWRSKCQPFWSYGRAQIRNIVDVATGTFAEKMVDPWQWCFIHADGWLINFWSCDQTTLNPDFDTARRTRTEQGVQPAASVDMRQVFAVHCLNDAQSAEGALCPWEIHLNFQRGFLPMRVESEAVAKAWNKRVMQAVVENTKIQQMREHDAEVMAGIEEFGEHNTKDLARMRRLKGLWMDAIACVERGSKVKREIFYRMHELYDTSGGRYGERGDNMLSLNEVYVMASELMEVRTETIKLAVLQEERLLHDVHRPINSGCEEILRKVVSDGQELLKAYKHMSNPKHFMDRVVSFHARTDISREGKVDISEFISAAPLFLLPEAQLRAEGRFLRFLEHSRNVQKNDVEEDDDDDNKDDDKNCAQQ